MGRLMLFKLFMSKFLCDSPRTKKQRVEMASFEHCVHVILLTTVVCMSVVVPATAQFKQQGIKLVGSGAVGAGRVQVKKMLVLK